MMHVHVESLRHTMNEQRRGSHSFVGAYPTQLRGCVQQPQRVRVCVEEGVKVRWPASQLISSALDKGGPAAEGEQERELHRAPHTAFMPEGDRFPSHFPNKSREICRIYPEWSFIQSVYRGLQA